MKMKARLGQIKRTTRRLLSWLLRCTAGLCCLLVILAAIAFGLLQTPPAKSWLAEQLSRALSSKQVNLRIHGISGFLPFHVAIDEITVGDMHGPWLTARNVSTSISPAQALRGIISLDRLIAEQIVVYRKPVASTVQTEPRQNTEPVTMPRLPSIRLPAIELRSLIAREAVFGTEQRVSFSGTAGAEGYTIRLAGRAVASGWIDAALDLSARTEIKRGIRGSVHAVADIRQIADTRVETLRIEAHGRVNGRTLQAEIKADGSYVGISGKAQATAHWDGEHLSILGLNAQSCGIALHGTGALTLPAMTGKVNVEAVMHSSAELERRLGVTVAPGTAAWLSLDASEPTAISAAAGMVARQLTWQALSIDAGTLNLFLPDIHHPLDGHGQLRLHNIGYSNLVTISTAKLDAYSDGEQIHIAAATQGTANDAFKAQGSAIVRISENAYSLEIAETRIYYGPWQLATEAPLLFVKEPDATTTYRLRAPAINVNGAAFSVTGALSEEAINGSLILTNLHLARFMPDTLPIDAVLTGALHVEGAPDSPHANIKLRADHIVPTDMGIAPAVPIALEVSGRLRDGVFDILLALDGHAGLDLGASAAFPVSVSALPPAFSLSKEEPLNLRASGRMQIKPMLDLYAPDIGNIDGTILLDLSGTGLPGAITLAGGLTLTNGVYQNIATGTYLGDMLIELGLEDSSMLVTRGTASDGRGGRIELSGHYSLPGISDAKTHLMLQADNFLFARRDGIRAAGSGTVTLTEAAQGLRIDAALRIDDARINIDDLPAAPPPVLYEDAPQEDTASASAQSKTPMRPIDLDINIRVPSTLFIQGNTVDMRWGGALGLARTNGTWSSTGKLESGYGTFSFLGRQFRIERSSIMLDGNWPPEPLLDITATYTHADMTASLHVAGRIRTPSIRLTSTPPYPENEIISRILFGQTLATVTPLQAYQIVAATGQLRGHDGMDIMRAIRSKLGVDRLELREEGRADQGEATVAAGKYFGQRLYMEVSQPVGESEAGPKIRAQYELRRNITVESEAGLRTLPGFMLFWRRDY